MTATCPPIAVYALTTPTSTAAPFLAFFVAGGQRLPIAVAGATHEDAAARAATWWREEQARLAVLNGRAVAATAEKRKRQAMRGAAS